jgi:prepilin-type N-terminal cleavage/methylation domain-containing protein
MKRPFPVRSRSASTAGFTLIELLVATALSLLLLGVVITMFGQVSESIVESRAMLEAADRLRLAEQRLHQDLINATAIVNPPGKPDNNRGYLEIIEGGTTISSLAHNTNVSPSVSDGTVGEVGDILMFTTRSGNRPFVGKFASTTTTQSNVAEVAWFVRGHTLHRRMLLVAPSASLASASSTGFYRDYDISARWDSTASKMVPNTLADLTRRECRFAHGLSAFPYSASWGQLGLPTLAECSDPSYDVASPPTGTVPSNKPTIDFWLTRTSTSSTDSAPWSDQVLCSNGTRLSDDIILTNVIGFDVKVWDSTQNMYVDLGISGGSGLGGSANTSSGLTGVYDTWSSTYFGTKATNGLDDNGNGIVDDAAEQTNPAPYAIPLRGIQVKIRTFEPDSRQIREVTVERDFLPQ